MLCLLVVKFLVEMGFRDGQRLMIKLKVARGYFRGILAVRFSVNRKRCLKLYANLIRTLINLKKYINVT